LFYFAELDLVGQHANQIKRFDTFALA